MGVLEKLGTWLKAEGDLNADLVSASKRLEATRAAQPASADPADHRQWRLEVRELEDEVASIQDSLAFAAKHRAAAKEAADQAEGDRRYAEVQTKVVPAHAQVTREIEALQAKLAAKLRESNALLERIQAANEARGHRPFIADGETTLRGQSGRTEPAVFEEQDVWEDGAGRTPFIFRRNAEGEDVPVEQGFTKKRKRIQVRAEREILPACPPRYADVCRLFDRAGNPLKI